MKWEYFIQAQYFFLKNREHQQSAPTMLYDPTI
jgi:hypothetical protein